MSERWLTNWKNRKPHRNENDSLELPLPLRPAELSKRIHGRLVPLLQCLQVQIPGAPTAREGTAGTVGISPAIERLQIAHLEEEENNLTR